MHYRIENSNSGSDVTLVCSSPVSGIEFVTSIVSLGGMIFVKNKLLIHLTGTLCLTAIYILQKD